MMIRHPNDLLSEVIMSVVVSYTPTSEAADKYKDNFTRTWVPYTNV